MKSSSILAGLAAAWSLSACASLVPTPNEAAALEKAAVEVIGMTPIRDAARGGKTVVRLFSVDDSYWPVVEFVAEPGGQARVSLNNVPGNFGATRMSAEVDPALWKLVQDDLAALRSTRRAASRTVTVDIAAPDGQTLEAGVICTTASWFVVADRRGVSTPGLPAWNSCANRQGSLIPGLYGLALHAMPSCDALRPQVLDAGDVARCLRILGQRDVAVELSNWVAAERERRGDARDDYGLVQSRFDLRSQFQIRGEAPSPGPEALLAGWKQLSQSRDMLIGLTTYNGLSDAEVEVRGEAYYADEAGQQLWFAPFQQVWEKREEGWMIREFVIDRPTRSTQTDRMQRYLEAVTLNSSGRR